MRVIAATRISHWMVSKRKRECSAETISTSRTSLAIIISIKRVTQRKRNGGDGSSTEPRSVWVVERPRARQRGHYRVSRVKIAFPAVAVRRSTWTQCPVDRSRDTPRSSRRTPAPIPRDRRSRRPPGPHCARSAETRARTPNVPNLNLPTF